jgi:hypothetical protein
VFRFIAIAALSVVTWNATVPALIADSESGLPACCRRDGKHHCAMMAMFEKQQQNTGPSVKAAARKCSLFPKAPPAFSTGHSALAPAIAAVGQISSHPMGKAQTEALYRISHSRARDKRGPPSLL